MSQLFSFDGKWMTLEQVRAYKKRLGLEVEKVVEEVKVEVAEDNPKPVFVCAFCGRECKSEWHLNKHLQSHSKDEETEKVEKIKELFPSKPISEVEFEKEETIEELDNKLNKILE